MSTYCFKSYQHQQQFQQLPDLDTTINQDQLIHLGTIISPAVTMQAGCPELELFTNTDHEFVAVKETREQVNDNDMFILDISPDQLSQYYLIKNS